MILHIFCDELFIVSRTNEKKISVVKKEASWQATRKDAKRNWQYLSKSIDYYYVNKITYTRKQTLLLIVSLTHI